MKPRILSRTHYQVDEPAYMEFIIKFCTSPISSVYDETIAERLQREIRKRHKRFNIAAAGYALDLARGLDLVSEQNSWTRKGHVVNLVAEIGDGPWDEQVDLNLHEKLLHFRLFLEADGAVLVILAQKILESGRLPDSEGDWNTLANELFLHIYSEYLHVTAAPTDRVALRSEVDRIKNRGYSGRSGQHKMFIHLQTLYRLGLIGRSSTAFRQYQLLDDPNDRRLQILASDVSNIRTLETIIDEKRWAEVAAKVFGLASSPASDDWATDDLLHILVPIYNQVLSTGTPLCAISTLIETAQIQQLAQNSRLLTNSRAMELLNEAQRARVRDIRFHVDRRGQPAFLKLSQDLITYYS